MDTPLNQLVIVGLVGSAVTSFLLYHHIQGKLARTAKHGGTLNLDTFIHPSYMNDLDQVDPENSIEVSKESDFPEGWWTSPELFALERRSIFSKTWLPITHISRFAKPGSYISLSIASFPIFLIKGKDNIVRAFHNVCRHRAYTVARKSAGSSLVLGFKAPQFEGIEGFDKSKNSLWEIKTKTDERGFVWINMDAGKDVGEADVERLGMFLGGERGSAKGEWVMGWDTEGKFGWKVAVQQAAQADETDTLPKDESIINSILNILLPSTTPSSSRLTVFPVTSIELIPNTPLWLLLTVLPSSASTSTVRCEVFTRRPGERYKVTPELLKSIQENVTSRVKGLEDTYAPLREEMVATEIDESQTPILAMLREHIRLEQRAGREILPASPLRDEERGCGIAERLCRELDDSAGARNNNGMKLGGLVW
ncbi:ISP domain-containing protein [Patellaria atrata CBS 101060]|uniref:ISP domain-containing protein n=1 Tax=Patellaria atrata CBS 101060 TaxID=1346257 RepID=A0A9P4SE89_9PEZI|nr:ISP domain-containing protein [Patellaria atrata CBS 101060]